MSGIKRQEEITDELNKKFVDEVYNAYHNTSLIESINECDRKFGTNQKSDDWYKCMYTAIDNNQGEENI